LSFHILALDVGGEKNWSSPEALFITWAFVISFDVLVAIVSALFIYTLLSPPARPGLLFWGSATGIRCLNVLYVGRALLHSCDYLLMDIF